MGKNQSASGLTNIVQYDNNGNISFVSGSTTLMQISSSGQITTTGVISGSNALSSSYALNSGLLNETGSVGFATTGSLLIISSSQQQISASQQQISSSLLALTASYNALSSSYTALSASYNTASSSFSTRITSDSSSLSSRTTQIENVYATTGSNTFTGTQNFSNTCTPNSFTGGASIYTAGGLRVTQDAYFSSSVYIKGNVTVFGTQSVSYISSSQLDIGTNIITVNTSTPSVRYGGLSVFDSGSTGLTGSIFWDSELNRWIYVNASGSGGGATYGGGMFISGPRNSIGLGCEQGTTACMLLVGQGGDHLTSSMIYHSSTVTCVPNTLIGSTISGTTIYGSTAVCSPVGKFTSCIDITSVATTGTALRINGDNLTTGTALSIVSNDGSASHTGNLVEICNAFNAGATAKLMCLYQGDDGDGIYINMARGGVGLTVDGVGSGYSAIFNNGNVGIGTCSPGAKLEVAGVDENILKLKNTSGQPALVRFNDTSTTGDPYIGSYGNSLAFGIYGVGESIRINSSRNVGIRTDAPFSLLHVGTRPGAGTTNPSLCSIATISNDGLTGIDLGGNVNANNVVGHINWVNYLGVGNYNTARIDVYANGAGNSGDLRFWTATVASSPTIRLTISSTGDSTFTCRVYATGLSTNASLTMDCSAPLSFSGTGGYIYMYSRRAGGSCGGILINNGTGNNIWFGEVGAHVYGFSTGGIGTDYTGTPLLNLDVNTQRIGIGTSTPDSKLEICSTNTSSELLATFRTAIDTNGEFTSIRVGNGNKYAYVGTLLNGADVAYFHTACNPFTNSCGIYLDQSGRVGMGLCQPVARLELLPPGGTTSAGCFASSTINIWDPTSIGSHSQITFGYGGGRNWAASYIGHVSTNSYSGGYGDLVFGTRNCGNDIQPTEKLRITSNNSIVGYSQWYTTYTKSLATSDGGTQTARIIEDSLGQWIQVGRFCAPGYTTIAGTWSSVRGLSTSLAQDAATEFSADWGGSKPTEIRVMGATDFCKWRETRTIDFIYRNIPGRPWCVFFNGGNTDGNCILTALPRYGFTTCGNYDGFGRWNSYETYQIGMSDGAYTNPSSAYTSPTASVFNWNTTGDAKLSAGHVSNYAGQDGSWTTSFGYDDAVSHFNDVFPNQTSQGGAGVTMTSAVWILLKFN